MMPSDITRIRVEMERMRRQIVNLQEAAGLAGVEFCASCGKPHKVFSGGAPAFIRVQLAEVDGSGLVCMDDPHEAGCFIDLIDRRVEEVDGWRRLLFVDLEGDLARWVLEVGAWRQGHPMNGFIQAAIAGETSVDGERLAMKLIYNRGSQGGEMTGRELLDSAGWAIDPDEYLAILKECHAYAVEKNHPDQARRFEALAMIAEGEARQARRRG